MRLTFDSNVLIYAVDSEAGERHQLAKRMLSRAAMSDAVLTAQAIGEFLNVVRRKRINLASALEFADTWRLVFPTIATSTDHMRAGALFAERYRLQFWDAVIWQAARSAGADHLLSEDMHDGLSLEGMTVIDPFAPANADRLAALLG